MYLPFCFNVAYNEYTLISVLFCFFHILLAYIFLVMVIFLFFYFFSFKLVGESAPLPKPRKINASRLSASESLKIFKQKVFPPLALPRTLNTRCDNANVLLDECINSKHFKEACCSNSLANNTSLLNEYGTVTFKPKKMKTCSKSKDYHRFSNEDQINQQKKISEIIGNITTKNTSLKSSLYLNHEIESNFDIQNSMKLISVESEEEACSKYENKFSNIFGDKFSQKKKILNIANVVDNSKSLNWDPYLSTKKYTMLDSIELNVSPVKSLSSDNNIISKKNENNSLEQDYKMTFENIDSCNENENEIRDNPRMILDNSSSSESVTKLESRSERLKLLHARFACQESLNAQKKAISSCKIEENTKTINSKDAMCSVAENSDSEKDKKMCTIISIIPKCERLNIREDNILNNINDAKRVITTNTIDNDLYQKCQSYQNEESNSARNAKRNAKIIRSQSKSDNFEMNILKRQRRYFTLPENIAHALNLNISVRNPTSFDIAEKNWKQIVAGYCTDHVGNADIDKGNSYGQLITGACCTINFSFYLYYLSHRFFILLVLLKFLQMYMYILM